MKAVFFYLIIKYAHMHTHSHSFPLIHIHLFTSHRDYLIEVTFNDFEGMRYRDGIHRHVPYLLHCTAMCNVMYCTVLY